MLTAGELKALLESVPDDATILVSSNLETEMPGESPELTTGISYLQEGEVYFLADTVEIV